VDELFTQLMESTKGSSSEVVRRALGMPILEGPEQIPTPALAMIVVHQALSQQLDIVKVLLTVAWGEDVLPSAQVQQEMTTVLGAQCGPNRADRTAAQLVKDKSEAGKELKGLLSGTHRPLPAPATVSLSQGRTVVSYPCSRSGPHESAQLNRHFAPVGVWHLYSTPTML
jgi:hypothetical protein